MSAEVEQIWSVAPYTGDDDLQEVLELVRRGDPTCADGAGVLHPGDVVWRLFQNLTIVPAERIRLVRDATGVLVGIIGLWPPSAFDLFVPPDVPDMEPLVRFMIAQAESGLPSSSVAVVSEVPSHQAKFAAILDDCGYAPTGDWSYVCNLQSLVEVDIPEPGHPVSPVRGDDLDARVELHRRVWAPSKFTRDGYDRLRTQPVYRSDLDLVAVTPEGEMAAYAIVWWDAATRTGEFEPVGADERFRRQGYGTAVMREGLRRLQALGAERAIVLSAGGATGAPANALYASTGFRPVFTLAEWKKSLPGDQSTAR